LAAFSASAQAARTTNEPLGPSTPQTSNRSYKLEITGLSGEGPNPVRSTAAVTPGMTVNFSYAPVTAVTNGIFPGATWSPRKRVPAKVLIWGSHEFGGPWKTVFSYSFYPDGGFYEFCWLPRNGDKEQYEIFDRNGKPVGVKSSGGYFWNGAEVGRTQFEALRRNLERSGGSTSQTPDQPGAPPKAAPPRR
jgi:hypothetical protein